MSHTRMVGVRTENLGLLRGLLFQNVVRRTLSLPREVDQVCSSMSSTAPERRCSRLFAAIELSLGWLNLLSERFVLTCYDSKSISYGIWYPSIDRVHVTTARGIHFSTMGHFVSRTAQCGNTEDESESPSSKLPKRLELLPEEALYLIERGALFCYKALCRRAPPVDPSNHELESLGAPMSVQQAFAEMIDREGMTLERYQVT